MRIRSDSLDEIAGVAELVDALDLGSSGAIRGGSSPPSRMSLSERRLPSTRLAVRRQSTPEVSPARWRAVRDAGHERKCQQRSRVGGLVVAGTDRQYGGRPRRRGSGEGDRNQDPGAACDYMLVAGGLTERPRGAGA